MSTRAYLFVIGVLLFIGTASEAWNVYDRLQTRADFERRISALERKVK